jgi:carbon-monoxide dehydrogenase iron sulfur subunit
METVFVRPQRCIGCKQCEFACAVAHSQSLDPVLALFEHPLPHRRVHVESGPSYNTSFPSKCRHCDPAPCVQVCPTGAMHRAPDHPELVLVDEKKCIGCAMCAMACPFGVVTFHPVQDDLPEPRVVATKCDGCIDRLRRALEPACTEACKVDALVFGDLNQLVQTTRERDARFALAAPTIETATPSAPETVAGWRGWGHDATEVAQGGAS